MGLCLRFIIRFKTTIIQTFVSIMFLVTKVQPLYFNFPQFVVNTQNITFGDDSFFAPPAIQLTGLSRVQWSVGRATYSHPVQLWDKNTNDVTNFTTHFSFNITPQNDNHSADGFAFLLEPFNDSSANGPIDPAGGGCLGLLPRNSDSDTCIFLSEFSFVAVEFDTYPNAWDPSSDHVGINNCSVVSKALFNVPDGLKNRSTGHAWITYDSLNKNLSVYLTYDANPEFNGQSNVSYIIDLSSILPETVRVGFSASTGTYSEFHTIYSWEFSSTLPDGFNTDSIGKHLHKKGRPVHNASPQARVRARGKHLHKAALIGGLVAGITVVSIVSSSLVYMWCRRKSVPRSGNLNSDVDDDFEKETGARRFTYDELSRATNNFSEEGEIGEGGFGAVYKGFLTDLSKEIAVKKISRGSKQGKKEYVSEVKIISRLRHKNLVQLLGWCHERGVLLLVYEYMPNGSLDFHLYSRGSKTATLPWLERYKIAQGLASALLYLHEEWEQCVLHRDIKPSNVMLDSKFIAKLGDFGLARLVDHDISAQTTVLAGTLGYLAPECVRTGKSSKLSDIYSFGVVALEICCGRRPIEYMEEASKVSIIDWVQELYEEGRLLEAVDETLEGEFDIEKIECLMTVGLLCCQPDYTLRPSIRQVINVLNSVSPLPSLPMKLPVPAYSPNPMNMGSIHITSSPEFTGSSNGTRTHPSQ